MDPTQVCAGGRHILSLGEGSWPFCFGPEDSKKGRKRSNGRTVDIDIFLSLHFFILVYIFTAGDKNSPQF